MGNCSSSSKSRIIEAAKPSKGQATTTSNKPIAVKSTEDPIKAEPKIFIKQIKVIEEEAPSKTINIKIKFKGVEQDEIIKTVSETSTFKDFIKSITNQLLRNCSLVFKDCHCIEIEEEKTLHEIVKDTQLNQSIFEICAEYVGLHVPCTFDKIREEYEKKTNLIGCPITGTNPFEVRIYCPLTNDLSKASLNLELYPELSNFGDFSAYCNGGNFIYLSGGEDHKAGLENNYLSWICKFNLADFKFSKLPNLNTPRFWHSMIWVPNNYVFIVGGNCNKSVEVMNTLTDEVSEDSIMNEYHSEPSLILANADYLYCFLGFKYGAENDYSSVIEKCNIRAKIRKWEIVDYKLEESVQAIRTRFFAVSHFANNTILFLGGDVIDEQGLTENQSVKPAYLFNPQAESFRNYFFSDNMPFKENLFSEKFIFPLKSSSSSIHCVFPKQTGELHKLILIDSEEIEVKEFADLESSTLFSERAI